MKGKYHFPQCDELHSFSLLDFSACSIENYDSLRSDKLCIPFSNHRVGGQFYEVFGSSLQITCQCNMKPVTPIIFRNFKTILMFILKQYVHYALHVFLKIEIWWCTCPLEIKAIINFCLIVWNNYRFARIYKKNGEVLCQQYQIK
jgi:hypothetical protein